MHLRLNFLRLQLSKPALLKFAHARSRFFLCRTSNPDLLPLQGFSADGTFVPPQAWGDQALIHHQGFSEIVNFFKFLCSHPLRCRNQRREREYLCLAPRREERSL